MYIMLNVRYAVVAVSPALFFRYISATSTIVMENMQPKIITSPPLESTKSDEVTEVTGKFINKRGNEIFYRDWYNSVKPRAVVVISHGFGDHSGRMKNIAQNMAAMNYLVTSHDHIGHGLSGGERGMVKSCDHYMNDLVEHTELKQKQYDGLPVFLLGHSMGAHLAVRTAMFHPQLYRGVISSAGLLSINRRMVTPSKYIIAKILCRIMPRYEVTKFDVEKMSKDPNVMKEFNRDELCYRGGMKAGWCLAMYTSLLYVIENMEKIQTPILALHGGDDVICEPRGSVDLIKRAASTDKTLKIYDGAYHSLFMEPTVREEVIQDCIDWIEKRI